MTESAFAEPPPKDVKVINPTTEPVPVSLQGTGNVSGTVSISGTPTVNAKQSGTWTVNVTDNNALQAIQREISLDVPPGDALSDDEIIYTVPADQRLVIEYISWRTHLVETGRTVGVIISVRNELNTQVTHTLNKSAPSDGLGNATLGQTVRIYAEPESAIAVRTFLSAVDPSGATFHFSISGYLVNLP